MESGSYADLPWRVRKVDLPALDEDTRDDLLMALGTGRLSAPQVVDFVQKRRKATRPYEGAAGRCWQSEERYGGRTVKVNGMQTHPRLLQETSSIEQYLRTEELREALGGDRFPNS